MIWHGELFGADLGSSSIILMHDWEGFVLLIEGGDTILIQRESVKYYWESALSGDTIMTDPI